MSEIKSNSTQWVERIDTRTHDKAAGITFVMQERQLPNTRGEAAISSRKANLDGVVALTLAFDQYKYGDELIAQVYSANPLDIKVNDRQADGYHRIQVFLGPADFETGLMLIAMGLKILKRVKQ